GDKAFGQWCSCRTGSAPGWDLVLSKCHFTVSLKTHQVAVAWTKQRWQEARGGLACQGQVTHILNVAYGVQNAFLDDFIYKTISILDLPETDITSYFPECFEFIEKAKIQGGVVLVHCNAGVSRAAAVVIGFLMNSERLSFARAFSLVKNARPAACPNPGFMEQLHKYQEQILKENGSINDHD
ncbi:dual specificity protein phosphatase 19, partial [Manacus vitellinus]|uniref:dual specificity protein phosphatase 19 n=1 Tax=Manacus vitellinus TaxID=328815 RepID=UPI00115C9995